ncbi:MAG: lipoate--protein ligase [Prevotella sp.]|jgi:lipoyltransferase/lipoate-protein ligase|nr:lipoate--protein ligase [Prevotella sp.]
MLYIALPDNKVRRLSFYLAMEEYVARHVEAEDCFFMWQVEPSVIFGRNQLIENEVNLDFCHTNHIQMYRRKSGGGCVYADMNNVMFSYITSEEQVGFTFNRYINMVVLTLQKLGVDASPSGRNDVMVGDRKVSGNAFYKIPGRSIVHGTMLYDTDMLNMSGALTPPSTKLVSKGVQSIRQRIDVLKNYIKLDIGEFKEFVRKELCHEELTLTTNEIQKIEQLEQEYLSEEFIYGKNPRYTVVKKRRIEGVGEFEARIEVKNGIIKCVNLMGDFFLVGDLDNGLLRKLKNVPLDAGAISHILPDHIDDIIMNLMKADFVDLLTT